MLAGAGKGIPIYRLLQKSKRAFSTGVLFENDVDLQVASALAAHVTVAPAFGTFGERELNEAKRWIDRAAWSMQERPLENKTGEAVN